MQKLKLFYLITRVGKLPISFCYALNVEEARKFFKIKVGFIIPYAALGAKAQVWSDHELSLCPCYKSGKAGGFTLEEWKKTKSLLPLSIKVAS